MPQQLVTPMRILCRDLFDGLPDACTSAFAAIESRVSYGVGAALFTEGQRVEALFVIHSGVVVVAHNGNDGPRNSLTATPGEVLGLSEAMTGKAYEATARALELSEVGVIARSDLLAFLTTHGEFAMRLVRVLSANLNTALTCLHDLSVTVQA